MIETLDEGFVSTWILAKDLPGVAADESLDAEVRRIAGEVHGRYAYPVDTQVLAPDGRFLGQRPANGATGGARGYRDFLTGSLKDL